MKKIVTLILLLGFIVLGTSSTMILKNSDKKEKKELSIKQETKLFEQYQIIDETANIDIPIFSEDNTNMVTTLDDSEETPGIGDEVCAYVYTCQSGFVWHSSTYYTICPLCGNPFRKVQRCCADL